MKIVVTGVGGFLGSRLVSFLLKEGHQLAVVTRNTDALPQYLSSLPAAEIDSEGDNLRVLFRRFKPEVVVHLAALYVNEHRFEDIKKLVDANLLLGAYLLEAMSESKCKSLVWAGTSWQHYQNAAYRPVNLYAATKQAFSTLADYYLDADGLQLLELHLYDSYGVGDPRRKLMSLIQESAGGTEALRMSGGEQRLHLVHVDDVVSGFNQACDLVTTFEAGERRVYRLPASKVITLRELIDTFNEISAEKPVKVEWGNLPYKKREVFEPWEAGDVLPGWSPSISLEEGIRELVASGTSTSNIVGQ